VFVKLLNFHCTTSQSEIDRYIGLGDIWVLPIYS